MISTKTRGAFLLPILALFAAIPAAAQTQTARPVVLSDETILRVEGTGFAEAPPKRAVFTIGVSTLAATPTLALESNNEKLAPVIEILRERGIPASDIQTNNLTIDAIYDENSERDEDLITGFEARNSLIVTSGDLQNVGDLISRLFEAGANTIDGPNFLVAEEEEEPLTRLAEADALREGRAQADAVAEALGMRVSRILLVSDGRVRFRNSSGGIVVTGSRIARTPIEPGEVIVTAEYNLEFALVPR